MDWISHSRTPPRSRLLELPPELRDAIFEFALTEDKTVVTFRLDRYQQDSYEQAFQPALTRVNRQVRHECLPIYYGCNDFVLHTEAEKYRDAGKWLLCNEAHLLKMKRASLWIRYVTPRDHRAASQGAIKVAMRRDVTTGCWKVSDDWRWITVVRRPAALPEHGVFLVRKLRHLLVNESTSHLSAEEFAGLLRALRTHYIEDVEG